MAKVNSGHENALGRVVRYLGVTATRFCDQEIPGMENLKIVLELDGSGAVVGSNGAPLYDFESTGELVAFLEAPIAVQVRAIGDNG